MWRRRCIGILLGCWIASQGAAEVAAAVRLPKVLADNMVVQRGQPLPIWGWASKDEEVTVVVAGQSQTTKADANGRWRVTLDKLEVGEPLEMTVSGSSGNSITLKNILVGEVWLCSGQSNMEMGLGMCDNAKEEIAAADHPQMRLFHVAHTKLADPGDDVEGSWTLCSPKSFSLTGWGGFSAAAYYFGRELHKELGVPIGLIQSTWGGTPAEYWTSRAALEANPLLQPLANQNDSSALYNGMIAPLIPYGIRGVIWYQGESNVGHARQYQILFPAMIASWRSNWRQGDFPFGFVQIAPFRYGKQDPVACAELREAQQMTLRASPNTGMVVTMDIGDVKDIHPKNKRDVGRRLALWALTQVYGRDGVYSGPAYKSMRIEGNKIRLAFDHVGEGLIARDGQALTDFVIAGEDQKFVPATATIEKDTIVVCSETVQRPVAVRYAWRDDAMPNLANKEGLPASPFRTDDWPGVAEGK